MRAIFDTNVLVSALLFEASIPAQAFLSAIDQGEILISTALVSEIHNVLYRPKFDRYITDSQREDFILALVETGILVDVTESVEICRDPKDNMILELAISGNADVNVTGDKDLLTLDPFRGIAVVSAEKYLENFITQ